MPTVISERTIVKTEVAEAAWDMAVAIMRSQLPSSVQSSFSSLVSFITFPICLCFFSRFLQVLYSDWAQPSDIAMDWLMYHAKSALAL